MWITKRRSTQTFMKYLQLHGIAFLQNLFDDISECIKLETKGCARKQIRTIKEQSKYDISVLIAF